MSERQPPDAGTWATINDLFHRAIERPPAERAAFVDDACAGREDLRREVLSLLASHDRAHDFIERSAVSAEQLLDASRMDQRVGRQIGHYAIRQVLGEGGMGVVYLAHDTRLGRSVALKALRARRRPDTARDASLQREAQAAAALTHPGVATVYALEEIDGDLFIASEYVPGDTLRTELLQGPVRADALLQTALGIARPLAAAHARGLVHRDLKPENVMRTPDGAIKILDFGLALSLAASRTPTDAPPDERRFGTPAYMSPEQARGEALDQRSDLFSFGTLIYELATGTNPFAGADAAATVARVLDTAPASLAEGVPVSSARVPGLDALARIVDTCLRKDPSQRYQRTDDLTTALVDAQHAAGGQSPSQQTIWWWQFHQAAASAAYLLLLIPLWLTHGSIPYHAGVGLFTAGLIAALAAATLRLHLWFAVRSYPAEWRRQRLRTSAWLLAADVVFVAMLLLAGLGLLESRIEVGLTLIGAAVLVLLSFAVIEPATERAAFQKEGGVTV